MATLLFWLSWRDAEPDAHSWARLLERTKRRSRFEGVELAGPGYRLYAARTRDAEPAVLIKPQSGEGSHEVLLLDRANGADDRADRHADDWLDARLLDGTATAAIRWHPGSRKLRLYRDLMGQRDLAYARVSGGLIVASGTDVLRAHPEISAELNPLYLAAYFAMLSPAPGETVFRDVRCLGVGEVVEIDAEGTFRNTTATLEPDFSWQGMTDGALIDRFAELFYNSVRNACLGSRRVGISLSAGMDSSSIAAVASRLPTTLTGGVVGVTHTLPDFPDIDEQAMVTALARALEIELRTVRVDQLLPFGDAALRPICPDTPQQPLYQEWYECGYREFSEADVDVWLNGVFGDHLFAHSIEWVVDAMRHRRLALLARQLVGEFGRKGWRGLLQDIAVRRPVSRMLGRVASYSDRVRWLAPPVRQQVCERLNAEYQRYAGFPRPAQCVLTMAADAATNVSGAQWYAQRHAMENRLPFRDAALTRFCLSLPADFNYRDGQEKWLLRQAMRDRLPEAVRQREKGSDLTPAFRRGIERQSAVLKALRERAVVIPGGYYERLTALGVSEDMIELVRFQHAAFAAWAALTS